LEGDEGIADADSQKDGKDVGNVSSVSKNSSAEDLQVGKSPKEGGADGILPGGVSKITILK
jgi:hypothetical protein